MAAFVAAHAGRARTVCANAPPRDLPHPIDAQAHGRRPPARPERDRVEARRPPAQKPRTPALRAARPACRGTPPPRFPDRGCALSVLIAIDWIDRQHVLGAMLQLARAAAVCLASASFRSVMSRAIEWIASGLPSPSRTSCEIDIEARLQPRFPQHHHSRSGVKGSPSSLRCSVDPSIGISSVGTQAARAECRRAHRAHIPRIASTAGLRQRSGALPGRASRRCRWRLDQRPVALLAVLGRPFRELALGDVEHEARAALGLAGDTFADERHPALHQRPLAVHRAARSDARPRTRRRPRVRSLPGAGRRTLAVLRMNKAPGYRPASAHRPPGRRRLHPGDQMCSRVSRSKL